MLRNIEQFTPWAIKVMRLENSPGSPIAGGGGSPTPSSGAGAGGGSPTPQTGGTGSGEGAASPVAGSNNGGTPTPTQQPTATGAEGANAENLRVLREGYDAYKKVGDVDTVSKTVAAWNKQVTHYGNMAKVLDYTPESFQKAMDADPVATIQQLQQEYAQHQATNRTAQPGQRTADDPLTKKVDMIEQRIVQQQAGEANQRFDADFAKQVTGTKALEGTLEAPLPEDVRKVLYDMVAETLKNDDTFMNQIFHGDQAKYMPTFKTTYDGVVARFFSVVNAYNAWQQKMAGNGQGNGQGQPQQKTEKLSFDDILTASPLAKRQLESMR